MADQEKEAATMKKRAVELDSASDLSPKKPRFSDDEEDPADELTRLLQGPDVVPFKVRFVPYPYSWQSISPPPVSSYITINVDSEESCGSSYSDSECSVMASIDLAGLNIAGLPVGEVACTGDSRGWNCEGESWDWDALDEALANFIGD